MSPTFRRHLQVAHAFCALALSTIAQAYDYNTTLFGQPGYFQDKHSIAYGVTNAGLVVGAIAIPYLPDSSLTITVPFRSVGGETTVLSDGASTGGLLRAANSTGMAVGSFKGSAMFWDGATPNPAATLRGVSSSLAYAVNDSGTAAGNIISGGQTFAATWNTAQTRAMPTILAGLDPDWPFGGQSSTAQGITAGGIAVGTSVNAARMQRPVVWAPGASVAELPTGSFANGGVLATTSDGSFMVGYVGPGGFGGERAAIWNQGQLSVLPSPVGAFQAFAYGVNASGAVAGSFVLGTAIGGVVNNPVNRGAIWQGGLLADLNDLVDPAQLPEGSSITTARGINDKGAIVGQITLADGRTQAYLLTPVISVPEPGQAMLLLSGLAGVIALSMRRGRGAPLSRLATSG